MAAFHDLGLRDCDSSREFCPFVPEHLVVALGKDADALKHRLHDHEALFPRGRVNLLRSEHILIRTAGAKVAPKLTEHEKLLTDDPGL